MRVWGTVLLVLGILFLIMFGFAELGGGHVGVIPIFVSGFLIFMGWNLRKSGKGILQSKPVAERSDAQTSSSPSQRGASYLRTTGPVEVVSLGNGAMLRLADRAFLIDQRYGATELANLGWGRVDYSPHGHVILGAWDRDGRSVYSLPGYNAAQ
jgi:hypothetical protein